MPTLSDSSTPTDDSCEQTHYKFVGWVEESYFNDNGTVDSSKAGFEIVQGGTTNWDASGKTYYAVWAEEEG